MIRRKDHEHIPPHRIWTYIYVDGNFDEAEHEHILECEQCLRVFVLCFNSENFGVVLKQLGFEPDAERKSA